MSRGLLCSICLLILSSCADGNESTNDEVVVGLPANRPSDSAAVALEQEPTPAAWIAGPLAETRDVTDAATITNFTINRNEGFDRLVIELSGTRIPSYHLEYIDSPVQCGSGEVVPIDSDAWLLVRLSPANAHDGQGRSTVVNRSLRPMLPSVREIEMLCDFEAQVEWVLGVATPKHFRVMELADPTRLVVDVRH